ncbi:MAG: hypothetical protein KDB80_13080 [Planctomycetes bacterium]|nr:hypothetical protein [Planctomycetota bacterium]
MSGLAWLAWQHAVYNRVQTAILVVCLAIPMFVPVTSSSLVAHYEATLRDRAAAVPLLAGRDGSRFDLTLAALWFREAELDELSMAEVERMRETEGITPLPMRLGFTARGVPVVGVTPEFFDLHGIRPVRGTLPLQLGEVVVGADVAKDLALDVGGVMFSDQVDHYDISKPPSLAMDVVGVLPRRDGPEDDVVFVGLETTWIFEGIVHGHAATEEVDDAMVLGRNEQAVTLSGAVVEYQRVTPDNIESFHIHADPSALPVSAIVLLPATPKAATLTKSHWNAGTTGVQIVVPTEVVEALMQSVFRIKSLVDALAFLLGACTVVMTTVVIVLSLRLRAREIETLHRIGCGRRAVGWLCGLEILAIVVLAALVAAIGFGLAVLWLPDLVRML